jgi:mannitol-1-phosphate/altronate dehydrogenase
VTDLNNKTLSSLPNGIQRPGYDRASVNAGIAHFSMGNFHRAHQAVYVDRCLALPGQQNWGILSIGLMDDERERAKATGMPAQNNLYTLTECPPNAAPETRVVGSIVEYLHAPDDQEAVLQRLANPAIRIVTMTVTEGGYNIDDATKKFRLDAPDVAHDLQNPHASRTVFGFVIEALARRRKAGVAPFTVLSCDNLRHNGAIAKLAFLTFARARDAELAEWIEANVTFPGCMVDRITPATSADDALERCQRCSRSTAGLRRRLPAMGRGRSLLQWPPGFGRSRRDADR